MRIFYLNRRNSQQVMEAAQDGDTISCSDKDTAEWLRWAMRKYGDTRKINIIVDETWKERMINYASTKGYDKE